MGNGGSGSSGPTISGRCALKLPIETGAVGRSCAAASAPGTTMVCVTDIAGVNVEMREMTETT